MAQPDRGEAVWEAAWILKYWDFPRDVNGFHPKTIRNLPGIDQVGGRHNGELLELGVRKYFL